MSPAPQLPNPTQNLLSYVYLLRKRWLLGFITFLSVVVTAVLYDMDRPESFTASIEILIAPEPMIDQLFQSSSKTRDRVVDMGFYVDHARSEPCLAAVIQSGVLGSTPAKYTPEWLDKYELLYRMIEAENLPKRRIIRVSTWSADAQFAYRIANTLGTAYVNSLHEVFHLSTEKMSEYVEEEIRQAELEVSNYRTLIAALEEKLKPQRDQSEMRDKLGRIATALEALSRERAALDAGESAMIAAPPAREEMDNMFASLQSIVPADLLPASTGITPVEAARGVWNEKRARCDKVTKELTPFHPDRRAAEGELKDATGILTRRLRSWMEISTRELSHRQGDLAATLEPPRASEEIVSSLTGETLTPDPMTLGRLESELKARNSILESLIQKRTDLKLQRSSQQGVAQWIRPASLPAAPTGPKLGKTFILGCMLGLLVGLAAIFMVESLDQTLKHPEAAELALSKPVLAVIPRFDDSAPRPEAPLFHRLVVKNEPHAPASEAYRTLAHKIDVQPARFIVLTSTGPQEGKSTTSSNLAAALTEMGKKVLLVSANLRRPTLHQFFGVEESPGLRELVTQSLDWRKVVQKTIIPGLDIICSGERSMGAFPAILSSPFLFDSLRSALTEYDFVIADAPPTAPVSDVFHFARNADAVLIVYMFGRASEASIQAILRSLEDVGGKILGIVMNDVRGIGSTYGYGYKYSPPYYGYGDESK